MIKHAYNSTHYYHKKFIDYGISPKDVQTLEDLKRIPILTREAISKNFADLVSKNFPQKRRLLHSSSGTTGKKLFFYLPKSLKWTITHAHLYRFYKWAGFKPYDRRVTIGGRLFTKRPPYWAFNRFENQLLLSIHHLSYETVDGYLKAIKDFSPDAIQGHPSGIHFLAERLMEQKEKIPVKAVFTTGETLFADQRRTIEEAFATKIFDSYGMGEAVVMASECNHHQGYHEASEYGIIEIIGIKNGIGEIVGTSLHNFAMPFIRYKIGDLVETTEEETCACSRGLPVKIRRIMGRIDDKLALKNRKFILPVTIRMAIKPLLKEGENYQLIQETTNEFHLKVSTKYFGNKRKKQLMTTLRALLGHETNIYIEQVEEIPLTMGKMRNVVSYIGK